MGGVTLPASLNHLPHTIGELRVPFYVRPDEVDEAYQSHVHDIKGKRLIERLGMILVQNGAEGDGFQSDRGVWTLNLNIEQLKPETHLSAHPKPLELLPLAHFYHPLGLPAAGILPSEGFTLYSSRPAQLSTGYARCVVSRIPLTRDFLSSKSTVCPILASVSARHSRHDHYLSPSRGLFWRILFGNVSQQQGGPIPCLKLAQRPVSTIRQGFDNHCNSITAWLADSRILARELCRCESRSGPYISSGVGGVHLRDGVQERPLHSRWMTGLQSKSQHSCLTFRIVASGFKSEYFSIPRARTPHPSDAHLV